MANELGSIGEKTLIPKKVVFKLLKTSMFLIPSNAPGLFCTAEMILHSGKLISLIFEDIDDRLAKNRYRIINNGKNSHI